MNWQPIETAPKDKTLVLVGLIRAGVLWRASDASFNGLGWYTKSGEACHWRTHWAPLPAMVDESVFEVTKNWLHANSTLGDGWTSEQLGVLGITWPPGKGWLRGLIGRRISADKKKRFEDAYAARQAVRAARRVARSAVAWRVEVEAEEGCFAVDVWSGDEAFRLNVFDSFEEADAYRAIVAQTFATPTGQEVKDRAEADVILWLRGGGYADAANALAELHVGSRALRGLKPLVWCVEPPCAIHVDRIEMSSELKRSIRENLELGRRTARGESEPPENE